MHTVNRDIPHSLAVRKLVSFEKPHFRSKYVNKTGYEGHKDDINVGPRTQGPQFFLIY